MLLIVIKQTWLGMTALREILLKTNGDIEALLWLYMPHFMVSDIKQEDQHNENLCFVESLDHDNKKPFYQASF